jgi:hypothetical protein
LISLQRLEEVIASVTNRRYIVAITESPLVITYS